MHDLCLCMLTSFACFGPRYSPHSIYLGRASDIVAMGTIINVFGYEYDAVSDRDSNLSPTRRRADAQRVEPVAGLPAGANKALL